MPKEKKKIGRPTETPGDAKRHPLNMRTTKALRDSLEEAVAKSGRSLAQEVEYRLERSFLDEEAQQLELHYKFGGTRNYMFALVMARVASEISSLAGRRWSENEYVFQQVREAVNTLLDGLAPPADDDKAEAAKVRLTDLLAPEKAKNPGKAVANDWLREIAQPQVMPEDVNNYTKQSVDLLLVFHEVFPWIAPLIGRRK